MREVANAIEGCGLDLHVAEGGIAAAMAALQSVIERKGWTAVTPWEPSWMAQRFGVEAPEDHGNILAPP